MPAQRFANREFEKTHHPERPDKAWARDDAGELSIDRVRQFQYTVPARTQDEDCVDETGDSGANKPIMTFDVVRKKWIDELRVPAMTGETAVGNSPSFQG
jgi:hypothetical protein